MAHSIKLTFSKERQMRFVSHLDLMRVFYRALRRAGLPVTLSQGFNPRPRISIEPALKLGNESDSLTLTVKLDEAIEPDLFRERLGSELPKGIELR